MVPGSSGRPDWDDLPSQAGPAPVRQAAAGINATMPASASRPLRVARSQLLRDIQVARRSEAKAISDGPSQAGSLRGLRVTEDFKLASCEDGAGCELQRPAEASRLLWWTRGPAAAAASDSAGVIFLVINLSSAGPRRKEVKPRLPSQCRLGNISYPRTLDIKITRVESKCGPITVTV